MITVQTLYYLTYSYSCILCVSHDHMNITIDSHSELEKLQKKQHKIKEKLVHMKVSVDNVATIPELPPQPNILLDTLEVSGLPPTADTELLKLYFESPRSGSHSGAVEKCSIVVPGTAHIKFQSSEGTQYIYLITHVYYQLPQQCRVSCYTKYRVTPCSNAPLLIKALCGC